MKNKTHFTKSINWKLLRATFGQWQRFCFGPPQNQMR